MRMGDIISAILFSRLKKGLEWLKKTNICLHVPDVAIASYAPFGVASSDVAAKIKAMALRFSQRGDDQRFEQGNIEYFVQFAKFAPAGGHPESLGGSEECVQLFGGWGEAAGGEKIQFQFQHLAHYRLGGKCLLNGCDENHRLCGRQDL